MADTEKITINLGVVDLGKIDLLVEQGFYTNRTDFIRTAIRANLDKHEAQVKTTITRNNYVVGILAYSASDLQKKVDKGEKMDIYVVGMLNLAKDITPLLARRAINSIKVLGIYRASDEVRQALEHITEYRSI